MDGLEHQLSIGISRTRESDPSTFRMFFLLAHDLSTPRHVRICRDGITFGRVCHPYPWLDPFFSTLDYCGSKLELGKQFWDGLCHCGQQDT